VFIRFKPAFITVLGLAIAVSVGILPSAASGASDPNPIPLDARQLVWNNGQWPEQVDGKTTIVDGHWDFNRVFQGYSFMGGIELTNGIYPHIVAQSWTDSGGYLHSQGELLCAGDLSCITGDYRSLSAQGIMQLCSKTETTPCIDSLEYRQGTGSFKNAEYVSTADGSPTAAQFAERRAMNINPPMDVTLEKFGWKNLGDIPDSATGPHIFKLPGATNSAGTDYYALAPGFTFTNNSDHSEFAGLNNFQVSVKPISITPGGGVALYVEQFKAYDGFPRVGFGVSSGMALDSAAYVDKSSIGYAGQFPKDLELRLKLRIPSKLGGWFQGHMNEPSISVTSIDKATNEVVIQAKPVDVPAATALLDTLNPANTQAISALHIPVDDANLAAYKAAADAGLGWQYSRSTPWNSTQGVAPVEALSKFLGNTARGSYSAWDFKRMSIQGAPHCMNDKSVLQGLLTTNAMTYQTSLPAFSNGEISYKVSGLHYDMNGKVFQGTYSFIMRDSVAQCLYGFNGSTPISGTVNVTSSDGSEQVAYTNVTDRNGFLQLTAQGFTFSSPVISAKLTQTSATNGSPAPASGSNAKQKTSITCVKGKVLKNVTAVSPKCPAGYKKKA